MIFENVKWKNEVFWVPTQTDEIEIKSYIKLTSLSYAQNVDICEQAKNTLLQTKQKSVRGANYSYEQSKCDGATYKVQGFTKCRVALSPFDYYYNMIFKNVKWENEVF